MSRTKVLLLPWVNDPLNVTVAELEQGIELEADFGLNPIEYDSTPDAAPVCPTCGRELSWGRWGEYCRTCED